MYQPYPGGTQLPEPATRPPVPQSITRAVQLMYAGAAASLIGIIIALTTLSSIKSQIISKNPSLTTTQVNNAEHVAIGVLVASGLIYLNSHASDFDTPELRPYLDRYVRGSGGVSAMERVKLMKLLWDGVGSEFGGRHELYEVNYAGSHEEIRRYALFNAIGSGDADRWKGFADSCMAEYDTKGWTVPDLVNSDDVSVVRRNP